ncbi:hypothetical protein FHY18_002599 [Xanthomonas arboricola]|nr:hypothetical protein [Xanthomonas sp. 3793]
MRRGCIPLAGHQQPKPGISDWRFRRQSRIASHRIASGRRSELGAWSSELGAEAEHISPSPAGRRVRVRVRSEAINSASRVAVAPSAQRHLHPARIIKPQVWKRVRSPTPHHRTRVQPTEHPRPMRRGIERRRSVTQQRRHKPYVHRNGEWNDATGKPTCASHVQLDSHGHTKHPRPIALPFPTCHHQPTPLHRQQRSAYRAQSSSLVSR